MATLKETTFSGKLNLSTENTLQINFRPGHTGYTTYASYQTTGNEALVFGTKNDVTSFMFINGENDSNIASDRWTKITPALQIKQNKVQINGLWNNDETPDYNFKVNGTSFFNGDFYFYSKAGTNKFWIMRESTNEGVSHYVDDTNYYINYNNDENSANIRWTINNTDTETGGGANASSHYMQFSSSNSGASLSVDGTAVSLDGHTHSAANGVTPEWAGSIAIGDTSWIAAWNNDGNKIKALAKSSLALADHNHDSVYVKKRIDGTNYNNLAGWYDSGTAPKYIKFSLPATSSTWAMCSFEFTIRQSYSEGKAGKLFVYGNWSSGQNWNSFRAWQTDGLSGITVYGSDKRHIYIYGLSAWAGITLDKVTVGDNLSGYDVTDITVENASSLPSGYQTATMYRAALAGENISIFNNNMDYISMKVFGIGYNRPTSSGGNGKHWSRIAYINNSPTSWWGAGLYLKIYQSGYSYHKMICSTVSWTIDVGNQGSYVDVAMALQLLDAARHGDVSVAVVASQSIAELWVRNAVWDTSLTGHVEYKNNNIVIIDGGDNSMTDSEFESYRSGKRYMTPSDDTYLSRANLSYSSGTLTLSV